MSPESPLESPRASRLPDRRTTGAGDRGVSSIVGTVIAVLGLVILSGLALVWVTSQSPSEAVTAQLEPVQEGTTLEVTHKGGDQLRTNGTTLVVRAAGASERVPLSDFRDQIGDAFDPGETICLAGPDADCSDRWAGQEITELRLVHEDEVRTSWNGRFTAAGGTLPDLTAVYEGTNPSDPAPGQTVHFRATIGNAGYADVANSETVTVEFHLDGSLHSTKTIKGAQLRSGDTPTVSSESWSATVGTHTVRVVADADENVTETDETNNEDLGTLVVVDPNTPPTASFSFTPSSPTTQDTITFDASSSTDDDGDSLTYEWDWTDDGTWDDSTSDPDENATHQYGSTGSYTVELRVTDGNGGEDTTTDTVTVESAGVEDPGHAWEDKDNDGLYDDSVDDKITSIDCVHTVSDDGWGLVVPPSVGDISCSEEVQYRADGNVDVRVDLESTNEHVEVTSNDMDVTVTNQTISAGKWVDVNAESGTIDVSRSTLESVNEDVDLDADAGITADGTSVVVETGKQITYTTDHGDIQIENGTLDSINEWVDLTVTNEGDLLANNTDLDAGKRVELNVGDGDIWLVDAAVTSDNEHIAFDVGAESNGVHVDGLAVSEENDNDTADVDPDGATIDGTPSSGSVSTSG